MPKVKKEPNQAEIQNLAANVRIAMKQRDWTQMDLAAAAGVQQSMISRILSGKNDPYLSGVYPIPAREQAAVRTTVVRSRELFFYFSRYSLRVRSIGRKGPIASHRGPFAGPYSLCGRRFPASPTGGSKHSRTTGARRQFLGYGPLGLVGRAGSAPSPGRCAGLSSLAPSGPSVGPRCGRMRAEAGHGPLGLMRPPSVFAAGAKGKGLRVSRRFTRQTSPPEPRETCQMRDRCID